MKGWTKRLKNIEQISQDIILLRDETESSNNKLRKEMNVQENEKIEVENEHMKKEVYDLNRIMIFLKSK